MSFASVERFVSELPMRMADDIVAYVRSVREALPEILRKADVGWRQDIEDNIVFIAAVRKFYSFCAANFWILENSLQVLRMQEVSEVRIGTQVYSRQSEYYRRLESLLDDLRRILVETEIMEYVEIPSYAEIARSLDRGR